MAICIGKNTMEHTEWKILKCGKRRLNGMIISEKPIEFAKKRIASDGISYDMIRPAPWAKLYKRSIMNANSNEYALYALDVDEKKHEPPMFDEAITTFILAYIFTVVFCIHTSMVIMAMVTTGAMLVEVVNLIHQYKEHHRRKKEWQSAALAELNDEYAKKLYRFYYIDK